jgi:hypothetical protein
VRVGFGFSGLIRSLPETAEPYPQKHAISSAILEG